MYHFDDKRTLLLAEIKSIIMVNRHLMNAQQDVQKALEQNGEMLLKVYMKLKGDNDGEN